MKICKLIKKTTTPFSDFVDSNNFIGKKSKNSNFWSNYGPMRTLKHPMAIEDAHKGGTA
jgi:hypothetical protein